ncbi:uncharacterized protein [Apostichopus japonicus]|uniref:uncharacterized protein n=1 Tax=Stichopus japonicus TaxID=307972 RepID=UPI003AB597BB
MPKAGYHPVCVLYQGNDSPYDGTYQLICRHQIKDQDFKPGDVVEVLPDPLHTDESSVSKTPREAIALGDEMIVGLLGNFCSSFAKPKKTFTQGSGCSSSNTEDVPPAKKARYNYSEEAEVKAETSSNPGQPKKVEKETSAIKDVTAVMNSICSLNHSILNEIRVIKQQHVSFQQELIIIKETLKNMAAGERLPPPSVDYIEMEDVPSQVGLRPAVVGSPASSVDVSQTSGIEDGMGDEKDECSQYPTSPITMDPPMPESFQEGKGEEFQSTPTSTAVSRGFQFHSYPHYANLNKHYNYHFVDDNQTSVLVGGPEFGVQISKLELDQMILKTATPTSFSYRLASKLFTTEEMLKGNTSGIGVAKTGIHFHKLNHNTLSAILAEVENRFPGARTTHEGDRRLLSSINDCCRNRRKRTLYNKMKVVPDLTGQPSASIKLNKVESFQE